MGSGTGIQYWVVLGAWWWVLMGSTDGTPAGAGGSGCGTGMDWAVLGHTREALGCAGLYWTVLGCTGLYGTVLGCTGLYWTVLG